MSANDLNSEAPGVVFAATVFVVVWGLLYSATDPSVQEHRHVCQF